MTCFAFQLPLSMQSIQWALATRYAGPWRLRLPKGLKSRRRYVSRSTLLPWLSREKEASPLFPQRRKPPKFLRDMEHDDKGVSLFKDPRTESRCLGRDAKPSLCSRH